MQFLEKRSLRIVHVEDRDDFAELTGIFLKRSGFEQPIVRFRNGAVALRHLPLMELERTPHLILLDLDMPEVGGLEVLRWIRRNFRDGNVPVYLLTSSDDPYDMRLAAAAAVTKYLLKIDLYSRLARELEDMIDLNNHRYLNEINRMPAAMAELALMGDFSDKAVILSDAEGRITWVNERFTEVYGYDLTELRGKNRGGLLQGFKSDPKMVTTIGEAVRSANPCECRIINYKKNGTPYPVLVSLGPVFDNGRLEGFLYVEQVLGKLDT